MGEALFYAVLLGMTIGAYYDFCRLIRLVFNDKFIVDFIFCIVSAIAFYCYLYIFNNGAIRMLYMLVTFCGFLLYIFTLGYVTKKLEFKISSVIKKWLKLLKNRVKSFKKVLQYIGHIYYNIYVRIRGKKSKEKVNDKAKKRNAKRKHHQE